jgi:6-phosphogluconolactonase
VSFPIGSTGTLSAGTATALGAGATPGPAVIDPLGDFVYVSDQKFGVVYFLTVGTGVLTLGALPYTSSTAGEAGIAIAQTTQGNEFLFVANQMAPPASISVFLVNVGGTLTFTALFPDASLNQPTGLIVDPTGSFLYVANQGNGTISQFSINATSGSLGTGVSVSTGSATSSPLYLSLGE